MTVVTAEESAQKAAENRVTPTLTWDEAATMPGGVMGVIRNNIQHSKQQHHLNARRESSYPKLQGLGGCSHERDLFEPRGFASAIVWCYGNNLRTCIPYLETLSPLQRLQLTPEDLRNPSTKGFTESTAKTLLAKIERVKIDYARWRELHPGQSAYGEDEEDTEPPAVPLQPFLHAIQLDTQLEAEQVAEAPIQPDIDALQPQAVDGSAPLTSLTQLLDHLIPSPPIEQASEPHHSQDVTDPPSQALTAKLNESVTQYPSPEDSAAAPPSSTSNAFQPATALATRTENVASQPLRHTSRDRVLPKGFRISTRTSAVSCPSPLKGDGARAIQPAAPTSTPMSVCSPSVSARPLAPSLASIDARLDDAAPRSGAQLDIELTNPYERAEAGLDQISDSGTLGDEMDAQLDRMPVDEPDGSAEDKGKRHRHDSQPQIRDERASKRGKKDK